jgi:hypothetical protein
MKKEEHQYLGLAKKLYLAPTVGGDVRFHMEFFDSPDALPIEFVVDRDTCDTLQAGLKQIADSALVEP